jgi:hypothetical protein
MPTWTIGKAFGGMTLGRHPLSERYYLSAIDKERTKSSVFTFAKEFVGFHGLGVKFKCGHDTVVPNRVLVFEDIQGGFAIVVLLKVFLWGVVGDKLFAELSHRERAARVLETSNELAVGSEEQVLPFLLEIVFGELIHNKY